MIPCFPRFIIDPRPCTPIHLDISTDQKTSTHPNIILKYHAIHLADDQSAEMAMSYLNNKFILNKVYVLNYRIYTVHKLYTLYSRCRYTNANTCTTRNLDASKYSF